MMIKLTVSDVANYWDVIKYGVEQSLPPSSGEITPEKMNTVLASLMYDKAKCWVSYEGDESKNKINAIVITQEVVDEISETKNLLLYSVFSHEGIGSKAWDEGFNTLVKYAASRGCESLLAFTDNKGLIDLAEHFGGDVSLRLIKIPLNQKY